MRGPARALANASGAVVLSVGYRRGPEHRFPVAVEDCYAATLWLAEQAEELDLDARAPGRWPATAPAATLPPPWRCWLASAAAVAWPCRCSCTR